MIILTIKGVFSGTCKEIVNALKEKSLFYRDKGNRVFMRDILKRLNRIEKKFAVPLFPTYEYFLKKMIKESFYVRMDKVEMSL